ncbi:HyaD/HybD family hydrogenase maturation endopeptidase [Halomonas sp. V046]|uniref:HyaD/HybD family hydrogenase maturation endopeptidase n=1 Tax=Halomonas sp. V046 TaxID=3459611 RepID=UPI0040439DDB
MDLDSENVPSSILVLGIGNVLWADEGFGVRAVEALHERFVFPDEVTVMDGGTQGLYLLPYVQSCRRLIIVDAIDYGLAPATVHVIRDDAVPSFMGVKKVSLHQTGFQEVLAAAQLLGWEPEAVVLAGVQPLVIDDYGGSLRPLVASRIDEVVTLVADELVSWGVAIELRSSQASSDCASVSRHALPTPSGHPSHPLSATDELGPSALRLSEYEGLRPSDVEACRFGDARFLRMAPPREG